MAFFKWAKVSVVTATTVLLVTACGMGDDSPVTGERIGGDASSPVSETTTMPDLVGLDVVEAEENLQDLGVQFDTITRASSENSGVVLSQDPIRGVPLDGKKVTITVAGDPPAVPDVTGMTFIEAKEQLEEQGFSVAENPILDGEATDGEVTAQEPGVGTPNAATVTLDVARRPVASAFADMELLNVEGSVQVEQAKANGVTYPAALWVTRQYSDDPTVFGLDLSRDYRQIVGSIGISDNSDDECAANVSFTGDGRALGESPYEFAFGETVNVNFTVDNILRLTVTVLSNDDDCAVVMGDFRAEGVESEIEATATATPSS